MSKTYIKYFHNRWNFTGSYIILIVDYNWEGHLDWNRLDNHSRRTLHFSDIESSILNSTSNFYLENLKKDIEQKAISIDEFLSYVKQYKLE